MDVVHVMVFDDTCEATLALHGRIAKSAADWKASYTILLLSNPGFRSDKRPTLSINANTYADVDPCMGEAEWLRAFAQRLMTREVVNVPFPEGGMQELNKPNVHLLYADHHSLRRTGCDQSRCPGLVHLGRA